MMLSNILGAIAGGVPTGSVLDGIGFELWLRLSFVFRILALGFRKTPFHLHRNSTMPKTSSGVNTAAVPVLRQYKNATVKQTSARRQKRPRMLTESMKMLKLFYCAGFRLTGKHAANMQMSQAVMGVR
jgi:hypothetical protein